MEQFAEDMTLEVEKHTSDYLKNLLECGRETGELRADLDIKMGAFVINSIYVIFMASLVSRHYRIRLREYLELTGDIDRVTIGELLEMVIKIIENILKTRGVAEGAGSD
jgi:TetR/AcrR family transcriptional regulator